MTNSATGGTGIAEFVMGQTLLLGVMYSRVCNVTNPATGGTGIALC